MLFIPECNLNLVTFLKSVISVSCIIFCTISIIMQNNRMQYNTKVAAFMRALLHPD